MRIGIFGGTFNPIHLGHLIVAEDIRENFSLERILFVPSARPPHKPAPELIDAEHRLEMTRLALKGNPYFDLSAIEHHRSGFSYSVDTVESFRSECGSEAELFFILGIDAFADINSWHEPKRLIGLCNFIVMSRPGFILEEALHFCTSTFGIRAEPGSRQIPLPNGHFLYLEDATPVGISSTLVRDRIREGRSLKYILPESVASYIISNGLYAEKRKF
ncbi:MAG: nicotinate-nucleotide adenylyltransferase [bacterium]